MPFFRFRHFPDVLVFEYDFAARDLAGRRLDELENGKGRRRLAGAGFADEPKSLAFVQPQVQVIDCVHDARIRIELYGQSLDIEEDRRIFACCHICLPIAFVSDRARP